MNQLVTSGIILNRTNYGEADRIITVLTPDHGKLRLMARGSRKARSKLAGGIELFSVSDITFIRGRGEIGTLISSRLDRHFGNIIKDINRVQLGYELIKQLNRATEDEPEADYFDVLGQAFEALNDAEISQDLIKLWFQAQLLKLAGHTPNLKTDTSDKLLSEGQTYSFDLEAMSFSPIGKLNAAHIKALRLIFSGQTPAKLKQVQGITEALAALTPFIQAMLAQYIRS